MFKNKLGTSCKFLCVQIVHVNCKTKGFRCTKLLNYGTVLVKYNIQLNFITVTMLISLNLLFEYCLTFRKFKTCLKIFTYIIKSFLVKQKFVLERYSSVEDIVSFWIKIFEIPIYSNYPIYFNIKYDVCFAKINSCT